MLETFKIVELAAQAVACIHLNVPATQIQTVMGPGIQELYAVLKEQGVQPTGPWFTHHLKRPSETFDFDICLPVPAAVKEQGRVKPGVLPAMRVAQTVYQGGYEGLGNAWGTFSKQLTDAGHRAKPDLLETYLRGPETGAPPQDWRTQLAQPLE